MLILVEPTSAVDAHTEAGVAEQLASARPGRTTVVCATSPLVLDRADHVIYVEGGRAVAEGTHRELLDTAPNYARNVRGEDGDRRRARSSEGETVKGALPVATATEVRRYARDLLRRHPRAVLTAVGLRVGRRGRPDHALVDRQAGAGGPTRNHHRHRGQGGAGHRRLRGAPVGADAFRQAVVGHLGERVPAELREDFVDRTLEIPLSTVERAGTGDLLTRTSRDVDTLSRSVRFAVPEILVAVVTVVFAIGALLVVGPLLALPCLLGVPVLWLGTRWYLRRARAGYLRRAPPIRT